MVKRLEANRASNSLLSSDEAGARVRVLPLRPPHGLPWHHRSGCHGVPSPFPGYRRLDLRRGNRVGEPKPGSTVPVARTQQPAHEDATCSPCARKRAFMFLPVCNFGARPGGALCRRYRSPRRCRSRAGRQRGVSDPHLAAPFFAPRPALRGSLTSHMHVTIIRRDGAMPVAPPNAAPVSSAVRTSFASTARARLSGSSRKLRSYR